MKTITNDSLPQATKNRLPLSRTEQFFVQSGIFCDFNALVQDTNFSARKNEFTDLYYWILAQIYLDIYINDSYCVQQ